MRTILAAAVALMMLACQASAQRDMDVTPEAVLDDLRQNSMSAEEVRTEEEFRSVEFVSLEAFTGADLQDLQEVLDDTEDGFAEVRTAIQANETFQTELQARHISISDVVAVTMGEAGNATIYINPPSQ